MYMSLASSYLRSLALTSVFSFIAPLVLVGSAIAGLGLLGLFPWLDGFSRMGLEQVKIFLQTFGNGNALEGSLVIGCACALVGALFDTYIFYRQRSFRQ
ncbi:hypothetical protein ACKFKG_12695 [Phormidesmis sp. 146-35]